MRRILEAAARLLSGTFLTPVLVGNANEVRAAAETSGFNIRFGAEILDPATYDRMDEMVAAITELRRGKMSIDECRDALQKRQLFWHYAGQDGRGRLSAGELPTLHRRYHRAPRPAADQNQARQQNCILLLYRMVREGVGDNTVLAMGDCAINIKPSEDDLVEFPWRSQSAPASLVLIPKVAFLSYSTNGSGKGEDVEKVRNACEKVKALNPDFPVDGEIQFDAAVSPSVGQLKFPRLPGGGLCQHLYLPRYQRGQHRLQDCPAPGQFRCLWPHPAGPERPHQRSVSGLHRDGSLLYGHHHRCPGLNATYRL